MWELLKEYLENNETYSYEDVEVVTFEEDGHKCEVRFKYANRTNESTTDLSLWDVLAYVNSKR